MTKAPLVGAFVVAGLLLAAGCGGGGKSSEPAPSVRIETAGTAPSPGQPPAGANARQRYVRRASAAITGRLEKAARLAFGVGYSAPSTKAQLHAAAKDLERAQKLFGDAAEALAAIPPPAEIAGEHRTLVASLRLAAKRLDRLIETARRGDRHGFETCCRETPTGFEAGDHALRRMKLKGYDLGLV